MAESECWPGIFLGVFHLLVFEKMVVPPRPDVSADMPPAIASGTFAPPPSAPDDIVIVRMTRKMARLLARLQQLQRQGARALVDMESLTVEVCGKTERFG